MNAATTTERTITESELASVAANARGENVYCGDRAGARTIAAGAVDAWDELSEDAQNRAIEHAMRVWAESRDEEFAGALITVEISRDAIDPAGEGSDELYESCGEYILDAVRTAFPGADVRAVGNGSRTSGVHSDGRDITRDVRGVVNAAFDAWVAAR